MLMLFLHSTREGCIPLSLYYQSTASFRHGNSPVVSFQQPCLSQGSVSILSHETLDMLCDASCFAAQPFYVVHQSPYLATLDLGRVIINTDIGLTLLSRVLST